MERIRDTMRDLALALGLGLGIGLCAGVVLFVLGALTGWSVDVGLTTARSGLMLAGGFLLLFSAGLFLRGNNLPEDAFRIRFRRPVQQEAPLAPSPRIFRGLHRKYAALMIGVGILLASSAADLLVRSRGI